LKKVVTNFQLAGTS